MQLVFKSEQMLNIILVFIPFFLISFLPEYGFVRIAFLIACIITSLLVIVRYRIKLPQKYFIVVLAFNIIICTQFLFKIVSGTEVYPFLYLVVILSSISSLLLYVQFRNVDKDRLYAIFKTIILFHCGIFLLQFLLWYTISFDFDLGYILKLSLSPHRAFHYDGTYRATGIYTEPSIYSSYIIALVTICFTLKNKITKCCWLGLFTCLLSFSTLALIQVVLLLVICLAKINIKNIIVGLLTISATFYITIDSLYDRYLLFQKGSDGSNNFKLELFDVWLHQDDFFYTGFGLVSKEGLPSYYQALGDLSLFVNNFSVYGVVFGGIISMVLVFNLLFSMVSIRSKLLFLVLTLKLSSFTSPILSFVIAIYLGEMRDRNRND
ncbi:hypothetical protein [Aeromonas dhakensis]|uniref:hypothetical protein n=1 Tax=Aeromonas dhakensis TaxID=196024 RepID=UPI001CEFE655|nr:hypothetical protein [Aeromonas dhakensis]UCM43850.1 hypothetical protein LEO73_14945 [Aeromonas dhakensis]